MSHPIDKSRDREIMETIFDPSMEMVFDFGTMGTVELPKESAPTTPSSDLVRLLSKDPKPSTSLGSLRMEVDDADKDRDRQRTQEEDSDRSSLFESASDDESDLESDLSDTDAPTKSRRSKDAEDSDTDSSSSGEDSSESESESVSDEDSYEEGPDYNLSDLIASANKAQESECKFKFCPWCSNLLQVKPLNQKTKDGWRWKCGTCPFAQPVTKSHRYSVYDDKAECEEIENQIIDTAKADEHRQRTEILCPKCTHKEAYFYQMQTRSADEPMTNFYECCDRSCRYTWRD